MNGRRIRPPVVSFKISGFRGLIEAGLGSIGVPVLNIEADCVDDRKFTEEQLRTRLEAFLEMLEGRPSPGQ